MLLDRLKWAARLLGTRTYVVLTDKGAAVSIPLTEIESMENQFLLTAQSETLKNFRSRLDDLIAEHEEAIALLMHREKNGGKNK